MIKGTFRLGGDQIEVVIKGNELLFFDVSSQLITTLEGLNIEKRGVIKEFPDLENNSNWKKEAINRLKEHMKKYEKEKDKLNYVRGELVKFGYTALFYQEAGFRPKKFNE